MPGDAVAGITEAGQVDKEPLFEKRRQRVVKIAELGEAPQVLGDIGSLSSEPKKVGQNAKAFRDLAVESAYWISMARLLTHSAPTSDSPRPSPCAGKG